MSDNGVIMTGITIMTGRCLFLFSGAELVNVDILSGIAEYFLSRYRELKVVRRKDCAKFR